VDLADAIMGGVPEGAHSPVMKQGVVTSTSPFLVQVGASAVAVMCAHLMSYSPSVGDVVTVLVNGADRLVLGTATAQGYGGQPMQYGTEFGTTAGACPGYLNFLGPGVTFGARNGDLIDISYETVIQINSGAPAIFRQAYQIFGPTGNVVSTSRIYYVSSGTGDYDTVMSRCLFRCTLGDGNYTPHVIGGMQAGSATLYDGMQHVMVYGSRTR
jgi:hypothetical protein